MKLKDYHPGYIDLLKSGQLEKRVEAAEQLLESCTLCPRNCKVDRLSGERGACRIGSTAMVASYGAHFGEERVLIGPPGSGGSGTIFFSGCNLSCIYCQNHDISQSATGTPMPPEMLAALFLLMQQGGCLNINLVTPTHVVPQILRALLIAASQGLNLPLVYNCGGYESEETLHLLSGVIDIYMPDFKYSDNKVGLKLSGVKQYWDITTRAFREMHRQVGDLLLDSDNIAMKGLLVRHLVLPEKLSGYEKIFPFLAEEISMDTFINIMDQYRPCWKAGTHPVLHRAITREEFMDALDCARQAGLRRIMQLMQFD